MRASELAVAAPQTPPPALTPEQEANALALSIATAGRPIDVAHSDPSVEAVAQAIIGDAGLFARSGARGPAA